MKENQKTPKHIYTSILQEVNGVLKNMESGADNEKLSEARNNAIKLLTQFQTKVEEHIKSLDKNAEWDKFTIAFYGETNAGKSTIIETIRIILKESTKIDSRKKFQALQEEYGVTEVNVTTLQQAIDQSDLLIKALQEKLDATQKRLGEDHALIEANITSIQKVISEKKRSASFWKKIVNLFKKTEEEIEYEKAKTDLQSHEVERTAAIEKVKQQQLEAQQEKATRQKNLNQVEEKYKHLAEHLTGFADGAIIGNGRSDFTLETQSYTFEAENQSFSLLDVPGIEGKEAKVMDSILSAVQKAHAVFYVTAKAAPPQTGDEKNKGTLEKIKEHLGAQTEVWTIFNKRITNPIQLAKGELINQDEQASLDDLNSKMREQLGQNYQQIIPLSAQPAFLAVADCILPRSQDSKSREKFLSKFESQELLQKSGMQQLVEFLKSNMAKDYKNKIWRSNFNKANQVVKEVAGEVYKLQRESFKPLEIDLNRQTENSKKQLEIALKSIKSRLESGSEEAINNFENSAREKIYARIEKNISNDDFKAELEDCIEEQKKRLKTRLPDVMNAELTRFQKDVEDVTSRFREYASDLLKTYGTRQSSLLNGKFEFNINIDNGIQVKGLLASLAGGALMAWNPGGWVILTLGAISVLVSLGKALIGFFSSDYKMSQQRKSVDSNLSSITSGMRESIHKNLKEAFIELEKKVQEIKEELAGPARQVAQINESLIKSARELEKLSSSI